MTTNSAKQATKKKPTEFSKRSPRHACLEWARRIIAGRKATIQEDPKPRATLHRRICPNPDIYPNKSNVPNLMSAAPRLRNKEKKQFRSRLPSVEETTGALGIRTRNLETVPLYQVVDVEILLRAKPASARKGNAFRGSRRALFGKERYRKNRTFVP